MNSNFLRGSVALVSLFIGAQVAGSLRADFGPQTPEPARDSALPNERFANVAGLISSGLAQRGVPSVSVAVSRDGRVVWERSFGWADRENALKASPDTVYSLASTTKPLIATGLLVLARKGLVNLDAPVERYLGGGTLTTYEGLAEDVTLRRLLHHTAALPHRTIELMQTERNGVVHPGGGGESYGLGWFLGETKGIRTVSHEGGWTGASVMLTLLPAEDIAVAVAMNGFDPEFVKRVADATIAAVFPAYGTQQPLNVDRGGSAAAVAAPPLDLPIGTYSGEIRTPERAIRLILEQLDSGELRVHLGGPASPAVVVHRLPPAVPRAPGQFLAVFSGLIEDEAARRHPHRVLLDLRRVGDTWTGTASAMATPVPGAAGMPEDQRMHFHLPYRVAVTRAGS